MAVGSAAATPQCHASGPASELGAAFTWGIAGYAGENDEKFAALAREDNEDVERDAQAEHHPKKAKDDEEAGCMALMARLGENLRTTRLYGEEGSSVREEQEGWGLLMWISECCEQQQ
jgi:hypothetical protein